MKLVRRTYSLPVETLERFERRVEPGNRSAIISDLMDRWVEEQENSELRSQVIEGCRDMADVYLEMEQEFHALEEESGRA